eukprot:TCONS_00018027-protein
MNEAHCAVDRGMDPREEIQRLKQENAKLREDKEKENLKHQIKCLEMEKEIQNLKHDQEIIKLKVDQKQAAVNRALEGEIQTLKHKIELLKIKLGQNDAQNPPVSKLGRLVWGAEMFFEGNITQRVDLYPSYKEWYENISSFMGNKELYRTKKFSFMKKEFEECKDYLGLVLSTCLMLEQKRLFMVQGLPKSLWENVTISVLHPTDSNKCAQMVRINKRDTFEQWSYKDIPEDFFYGDLKSAIVFIHVYQ